MGMKLFGLTGGIASGKSTIGKYWKEKGLPVIDADQVSRVVVQQGSPGFYEVISEFGHDYLTSDMNLDRKKLGALVFSNPSKLRKLEEILWPRINSETQKICNNLEAEGNKIACYDAAIIVERGHANRYRPLVVVMAPEEVRISRMISRNGLDRNQAMERIKSQVSDSERKAVADFVIQTNRSKEETRKEADHILKQIFEFFGLSK